MKKWKSIKRISAALLACLLVLSGLIIPDSEKNVYADGAGGGSGEIQWGGSGTYVYRVCRAYLYFDEGGWDDSTTPGSGTAAHQPQMPRGGKITDAHLNWWIDRMETHMENLQKADGSYVGPICYLPDYENASGSGYWSQVKEIIRSAMQQACDRALASDPQGNNARIIGVAWEYINPGTATTVAYENWYMSPSYGVLGPNDFNTLFGGSTSRPRYPGESNLSSAYGWDAKIDRNNDGNYSETEDWRHFAYDMASQNQPSSNTNVARIYFIAVTDNQPISNSGYLQLKKTSDNPSITDNNPCYSLIGSTYEIYDNAELTGYPAALLQVNSEDGTTDKVKLPKGSYYFKEVAAGKGYSKKQYNAATDKIELSGYNSEDDPALIETTDTPLSDPFTIYISKENSGGVSNPRSLEGTQFTVLYYALDPEDEYSESQLASFTPTRQWIIETKPLTVEDKTVYRAMLTESFLVSGSDPLYMEGSQATIPLGYFTLQETKAAEGYILDSGTITAGGTALGEGNAVIVGRVDSDGVISPAYLNAENASVTNDPVLGGFSLSKLDDITKEPPKTEDEVLFDLYNDNDYSVRIYETEYGAGEKIGSYSFKANEGFSFEKVLPAGNYMIKETRAPKGYKINEEGISIAVDGEDPAVELVNSRETKTIRITKTSEDQAEESFKFVLSGTSLFGDALYMEADTDAEGIAVFEGIEYSDDKGYTINEVDTPQRYDQPDPLTLLVNEDSPDLIPLEIENTIKRNERDNNPDTGDESKSDSYAITAVLSFAFMIASALELLRRKKNN